jgi:hypothetical protein
MTYDYVDLVNGDVHEVQQKITDKAWTHVHDGVWLACLPGSTEPHGAHPVKRLISAESGGFRLVSGPSGGWGQQGYSKTPQQRSYEAKTGRKTTTRAE